MITIVESAAGLSEALPGHGHESVASVQYLVFSGWTAVIVILLAGIFIESLITGLIVRFFSKVRPDLLGYSVT
jgi:cobalt/nickel transport system permease protein